MQVWLLALSESEKKINQPPDKWNQRNTGPERFLCHRAEILAGNVDNGQNGQDIKDKSNFNPKDNRGCIQCYPFIVSGAN